jgi:hypothetical protein
MILIPLPIEKCILGQRPLQYVNYRECIKEIGVQLFLPLYNTWLKAPTGLLRVSWRRGGTRLRLFMSEAEASCIALLLSERGGWLILVPTSNPRHSHPEPDLVVRRLDTFSNPLTSFLNNPFILFMQPHVPQSLFLLVFLFFFSFFAYDFLIFLTTNTKRVYRRDV